MRIYQNLKGGKQASFDEIALELGVTKQAVQLIEKRALQKLRESAEIFLTPLGYTIEEALAAMVEERDQVSEYGINEG